MKKRRSQIIHKVFSQKLKHISTLCEVEELCNGNYSNFKICNFWHAILFTDFTNLLHLNVD